MLCQFNVAVMKVKVLVRLIAHRFGKACEPDAFVVVLVPYGIIAKDLQVMRLSVEYKSYEGRAFCKPECSVKNTSCMIRWCLMSM